MQPGWPPTSFKYARCWLALGTTMHVGLEETQSQAPGSRALGREWTTAS